MSLINKKNVCSGESFRESSEAHQVVTVGNKLLNPSQSEFLSNIFYQITINKSDSCSFSLDRFFPAITSSIFTTLWKYFMEWVAKFKFQNQTHWIN